MQYYTKILPHENKRRLTKIREFTDLVVSYFNNCKLERFEAFENEQARKLRHEINMALDEAVMMVHAAGISTQVLYFPPPARGGYAGNVDVFLNIFNLPFYGLNPQVVCDDLERAYGIYERNRRAAKIRLINPFFYMGRLLDYISELPFAFLGKLGFNRKKAESSGLGRIIKGFVKLVFFLAAAFAVLHYLGYMDAIKEYISGIFR